MEFSPPRPSILGDTWPLGALLASSFPADGPHSLFTDPEGPSGPPEPCPCQGTPWASAPLSCRWGLVGRSLWVPSDSCSWTRLSSPHSRRAVDRQNEAGVAGGGPQFLMPQVGPRPSLLLLPQVLPWVPLLPTSRVAQALPAQGWEGQGAALHSPLSKPHRGHRCSCPHSHGRRTAPLSTFPLPGKTQGAARVAEKWGAPPGAEVEVFEAIAPPLSCPADHVPQLIAPQPGLAPPLPFSQNTV